MNAIIPYAERLAVIAEAALTPEVLLSTGVITAVASITGKVAWAGATSLLSWLRSWQLRSIQQHTVALARKRLPFDHSLVVPRCLVVRYGTDNYIERLASDREKYDGRLQNRAITVPITVHEDGSTGFRLSVPVHKRLGTQFKCFVDVLDSSKTAEIFEFLSRCPSILSPDRSSSPLHRDRIYFLLNDFAVTDSIDGHKNNMCYPE